jgi:hypothetical protein
MCLGTLWGYFAVLGSVAVINVRAELPILPPTTLEIDLAFPRMGATHRRAYPFPIIFAIQGSKNVWPYHLRLQYQVYDTRLDEERPGSAGSRNDGDIGRDAGYGFSSWTSGEVPNGQDPYFSVGDVGLMLNSSSTDYHIVWEARMPDNCTADDNYTSAEGALLQEGDLAFGRGPVISGTAHWKVSDDAPMDIAWPASDDSCPDVEAMLLPPPQGSPTNSLRLGGTVTEGKCIFFDEENLRPHPNPCAAKPDSALAATVTKTFLEKLGCKPEDSWPADSRGHCFDQPGYCRGGRCNESEGRGAALTPGVLISLISVTGVCWMVGAFNSHLMLR